MANCNKCGKKLGFLERSQFYGLCKECNTKSNRDYEEWEAKQRSIREDERKKVEANNINPNATCIFCGYINEQKHAMEHVDEYGNVCNDTFTTYRCSKFRIDIDKYNW